MAEVVLKLQKKDGTWFEIGKSMLQSVETLTQSTSDSSSIYYGVLSNTGSAEIIDVNGQILKEIEIGNIDNSKSKLEIWVNGNRIARHLVSDSDYYKADSSFTLNFTDNTTKWDSTYPGRQLTDPVSAYELIKEILGTLSYSDSEIDEIILNKECVFGDNEELFGTVSDFLKTITIEFPYLESSTYREVFTKICELAQLQCFQNEDGYPVFISARPVLFRDQSVLNILRKDQVSEYDGSIITKNKITDVKYEQTVSSMPLSWTDFVEQDSISFNFFEQSDKQRFATIKYDGEEISKVLYGNYWDNYKKKVYTDSENASFKTYSGDSAPFDKSLLKIVKVTLDRTKKSKYDRWMMYFVSYSANHYDEAKNLNNKSSGDPVLENYSSSKISAGWLWSKVVLNETEAIEGCNTDYNYAYLVGGENTVDLYFVVQMGTEFGEIAQPTYYTGEIRNIFLNGQISIRLRAVSSTTTQIGDENTDAELKTNELFCTSTLVNGETDIYTHIINNLKSDYSEGRQTGSASLFATKIYDNNGVLAKDFDNGQIVNVGDVFKFEKSNKRHLCTSCSFKWDGESRLTIKGLEVLSEKQKYWNPSPQYIEVIPETSLQPSSIEFSMSGDNVFYVNKYANDEITEDTPLVYHTDTTGSNTFAYLGKSSSTSDVAMWRDISVDIPLYFSADCVWTTEKNTYFSYYKYVWGQTKYSQYKLNTSDNAYVWEEVSWNGFTNIDGTCVWNIDGDTYYSNGSNQYKLDEDTMTWEEVSWNGLTTFYGYNIWKFYDRVFLSNGMSGGHYELNKETNTWSEITIDGLQDSFYGYQVWFDGLTAHIFQANKQYTLTSNKGALKWVEESFVDDIPNFDHNNVWRNKKTRETFYSDGSNTYILT